jgi:hypothetical protein
MLELICFPVDQLELIVWYELRQTPSAIKMLGGLSICICTLNQKRKAILIMEQNGQSVTYQVDYQ